MNRKKVLITLGAFTLVQPFAVSLPTRHVETQTAIGREVAIPRHLDDDEEFNVPLSDLIAYGQKLFSANWTEQEGGGRPLTKGTGKGLTDATAPLTGKRAFNRISAPDSNSCAGCH